MEHSGEHSGLSVAQYAGFWRRFWALVVDLIVVGVGSAVIGGVVGGLVGFYLASKGYSADEVRLAIRSHDWAINLATNLGSTIYFVAMNSSSRRGTLGKMALGIEITDLAGNRISALRAFGRELAKFLSALTLGIGYFMAGWTRRKQALHDKVAGTLVVRKGSAGVF